MMIVQGSRNLFSSHAISPKRFGQGQKNWFVLDSADLRMAFAQPLRYNSRCFDSPISSGGTDYERHGRY